MTSKEPAPSPFGVGSCALAPSPTSLSPHPSLPTTTANSSSSHNTAIPLAIRPEVASVATAARLPLSEITMASVLTPSPQSGPSITPISMTSKEWVIPPRPKPGRKPATDTPPTKRKAQNRAAQRAFRERRAARVGELEEQIEEQKEENERVQRELKERIHSLEVETQTLRTRCQVLENMLERERLERRKWSDDTSQDSTSRTGSVSLMPVQYTLPRSSAPFSGNTGSNGRKETSTAARDYDGRNSMASTSSGSGLRNSTHSFAISEIISPPEELEEQTTISCGRCAPGGPCACAEEVLASAVVGCGNCSLGTKCECLEATVRATLGTSDLKRPHRSSSPSVAPDEKRLRSDAMMEIDFTATFASKEQTGPSAAAASVYVPPPVQQSGPPKDPCGFCKEGTYCVCADALNPVMTPAATPSITIPPAGPARQVQTPPPSETDVVPPPFEVTATGAIKLPGLQSLRYGAEKTTMNGSSCGPGGPGTCAQCLSDPMSGLFCRSLAASLEKRGQIPTSNSGCCGGGGAGGGCCKTQPARTVQPNNGSGKNKPNSSGLSLSCADAYKTLASHQHFDEATDEIGTWLPLLRAAPIRPKTEAPSDFPAQPRPAMEVEAASIMSVLKGFDVRFGK